MKPMIRKLICTFGLVILSAPLHAQLKSPLAGTYQASVMAGNMTGQQVTVSCDWFGVTADQGPSSVVDSYGQTWHRFTNNNGCAANFLHALEFNFNYLLNQDKETNDQLKKEILQEIDNTRTEMILKMNATVREQIKAEVREDLKAEIKEELRQELLKELKQ